MAVGPLIKTSESKHWNTAYKTILIITSQMLLELSLKAARKQTNPVWAEASDKQR